ncbi:trypsin-1 [Aethina tumida]|uniref:trypsin-1 n=1 Tax=Aethina tumida TaxID=116153 RepID=UPI00096B56FA|nr:trypsin-1 [Aethina tumida]
MHYHTYTLILLFAIPNWAQCSESTSQNETEKAKILIDSNYNIITHLHKPKPTSAPVEYEPGVPPGWPSKRPTTKRPPPRRDPDIELFNQTVMSEELHLENATNEEFFQPNQTNKVGGVVDWFLGIVGIRPPESTTPNPPVAAPIPTQKCPSCKCGITYKKTRIVGGVETKVNEFPWMTALMYNNRFYCGASLINNKYILTAAHCVNGFSRERLTAVFLDHDRSNSFETKTISRKIKRIIRHRSYGQGGTYNNDIAILQLDNEVSVAGLLKPVCLPQTGKSFTGFTGIAVGWGATKEHGQVSNKLREVEVPILSNTDCRKTGYGSRITENMLCAGYAQGQKDSCQGDSGGPLHVVNNLVHEIAGVVSWGEGCAEANYPGVYTRVNRYVSWIKSNTRDACYC